MGTYLESTLEKSFLDYSAFVLQRRAIPDARDGMKYTARQIIHAQLREGLTYKKGHKKSQKSVSAATAFSYVHGDTSCYEQIIRMGRKYVQRYFLEDIVGNGGQPNASDSYAAARYTEAALSPLACTITEYLESDTLAKSDWSPTYDETGYFPTVFPSIGFYGICNGSFGSIGVGLISSIPQFNLNETNNVIIKLIDNPKAEFELLPDFASGGILLNPQTTITSLSKGEGKSAILRAHVKKYPKGGYLEVIDLPYGVYTNTVCGELGKAIEDGVKVVTEFKDLTQKGVQIRVYGPDLDALEHWMYKNTSIQKHFTIKLIMLDKGKTPKLFTLREALLAHITHAAQCLRNKYQYDLKQLKDRAHILEGYLKAFSILDEVIAIIRGSNGRQDAINQLSSQKGFSTAQATAIVDLKLHRLSHLDVMQVQNELDRNMAEQKDLEVLLNDKTTFNNALKQRYADVAAQYGDERRTEICAVADYEGIDTSKIEPDTTFFLDYYDYKLAPYYTSYDGEDKEFIQPHAMYSDTEYIILTNKLRGCRRKGTDFTLGRAEWNDLFKLQPDEHVVTVIEASVFDNDHYWLVLTLEDGTEYAMHYSYVTRASERGKKLTNKKLNVRSYMILEQRGNLKQLT